MSSRICLLLGSVALMYGSTAISPALSDEHTVTERLNREYRVMPRANPHHRFVWVRRWVWDDFWGDYHVVWVPKVTTYRTVSYTAHRKTRTATISEGSGDNPPSKSKDADNGKSDNSDKDNTTAADGASLRNTTKSDKDTKNASVAPTARPLPPANIDETKLASLDSHAKPTQTAEKPAAKLTADLAKPVTPAEIRSAVPLAKVNDPKDTLASTPIKSVWGDTIGKVRRVDVNGGNLKTVDADLGGKSVVKMDPARLKYVKSRGLLITTLSKEDAARLPKANTM